MAAVLVGMGTGGRRKKEGVCGVGHGTSLGG